jgi:toxin ParE1/3/4
VVRYKLSRRAAHDLDAIADYILEDNPSRAISFVEELTRKFETIADLPAGFANRDDLPADLRALVHGSYRIVYRVEHGTPHILRVLHAAQNASGLL